MANTSGSTLMPGRQAAGFPRLVQMSRSVERGFVSPEQPRR